MLRTPSLSPRSGLASLGLILFAALLAGGLVFFLWTGTDSIGGRRSEAAERGTRAQPATDVTESDEERGAPPVELVLAGTNLTNAQATETAAAPPAESAVVADGPAELELAVGEGDAKVEGPPLRYERGTGKSEDINGKEQRRERRADRGKRKAEQAAAGIVPEKKLVESPKKKGDSAQVKRVGAQDGKPERRPKKDAPEDSPQDG